MSVRRGTQYWIFLPTCPDSLPQPHPVLPSNDDPMLHVNTQLFLWTCTATVDILLLRGVLSGTAGSSVDVTSAEEKNPAYYVTFADLTLVTLLRKILLGLWHSFQFLWPCGLVHLDTFTLGNCPFIGPSGLHLPASHYTRHYFSFYLSLRAICFSPRRSCHMVLHGLLSNTKHEKSSRSPGPQCSGLCQVVNEEDYVRQ